MSLHKQYLVRNISLEPDVVLCGRLGQGDGYECSATFGYIMNLSLSIKPQHTLYMALCAL